ncbi:MAG TPA: glycosyltransferase family 9 protein [Isosphaeraceae bacterium]
MQTGRYRYTKWRWRILVGVVDAVGGVAAKAWRVFRPIRPFTEPRRILILQLDHLGDALLTSPLIAGLRSAYPNALIDVVASPSNREVFEANPDVDRVHLASRNWFERKPGRWALGSAVWSLGRFLRGGRYDLGIDVRGDILSVAVLALASISRRLGWTMGGGGFLLTDVADWVPGRHEVGSRVALLERLGIRSDLAARIAVPASDADRVRVAHRLRDAWQERVTRAVAATSSSRAARSAGTAVLSGSATRSRVSWEEADWLHAGRFGEESPLLAVHLGAGTSAKRWPVGHWQELIRRFLADGWRIILVGGPDDVAVASRIARHERLRDWTGRLRLAETAALLERADFFIGSDSGPAHVAASAGIPSLILFSGTNRPRQWRPWSRRTMILRNRVACRPCHQKVCPLADHPCMSGLTPDRVYRAALRWWKRLHRRESPHAPL